MNYKNFFYILLLVLLVKAGLMVGVILYSGIGLGPDEAQYWTWSQHLDWGYYSKPPGIAWIIWLGCKIFGQNELGVRAGSILMGTLIPIAIYWAGKCWRLLPETSFWAALIMALTPLGLMATLLAITDVGMILFWTIALGTLGKYLGENFTPNYVFIGLAVMAGALFKWPTYLFWIFVLGLMPFNKNARSWTIIQGIVVSLGGLLPSLFWNSTHNWVTFRHVFSTIKTPVTDKVNPGNFLEFVGSQAALLSPILFILLVWAFIDFFRKREDRVGFLALSCFIPLSGAIFVSTFKKMLGNWSVFVYPSGILFLAWFLCERAPWGKLWLKIGLAVSVILCGIIILSPIKNHVFKHNVGWNQLGDTLVQAGYNPDKDFVFGDKYQTTSLLSFYGPKQKQAYFLNLHGTRQNQFSFWPGLIDERAGNTGYFVVIENRLDKVNPQVVVNQLKDYFSEVEYKGLYPLLTNGTDIFKGAFYFRCINYNGKQPVEPLLY